ncbi:ATP binding, partial [Chrysochromulina tobinii]
VPRACCEPPCAADLHAGCVPHSKAGRPARLRNRDRVAVRRRNSTQPIGPEHTQADRHGVGLVGALIRREARRRHTRAPQGVYWRGRRHRRDGARDVRAAVLTGGGAGAGRQALAPAADRLAHRAHAGRFNVCIGRLPCRLAARPPRHAAAERRRPVARLWVGRAAHLCRLRVTASGARSFRLGRQGCGQGAARLRQARVRAGAPNRRMAPRAGTSSLLLSSYDQRDYPRVKCIDLGFASTAARLTSDETLAAMARGAAGPLDVIPFCTRADDLHALAYVVLELVLSASASTRAVSGGLGGLTSAVSGGLGGLPSAVSGGLGGLPGAVSGGLGGLASAVSGGLGGLPGPTGAAGSGSAPSRAAGSGSAPSRPTDLQSLKRLIEDVFSGDASFAFRDYCAQEPEWLTAVEMLDEADGAGWALVQALVDCGRMPAAEAVQAISAKSLLMSPWFDDVR